MAIVNKFNVNNKQVTLDADIIENMSANDVSYNSSLQYNENTVGDKLSELEETVTQESITFPLLDFYNKNEFVGDIGRHAYVDPTNHAIIPSEYYRYIWIRVKQGESIYSYHRGYQDNVSIGFSPIRDIATMTIIDSTTGMKQRSATAGSDGYFFVGWTSSAGSKIWSEESELAILKKKRPMLKGYLILMLSWVNT